MDLFEKLKQITSEENIYINEPMSKHTTFKTGGTADFLVIPQNKEELIDLLKLDAKKTIIGNGSNLLVKDNGIRGITIKLEFNEIEIEEKEDKAIIEVGAGVKLGMLASILQKKEIAGFEFASRNSWNYRWSNSYECRSLWKRNERNSNRSNMY